jgi:osmoprotectant transport system permease protein
MIKLLQFSVTDLSIFMTKLAEQIYLTVAALLIAIIISVPLGIWIAHKKHLRNSILGLTNILQTIPSLAVLGFLLPILGIGVKIAIVTLTLYALLPILRNTVTGLLGVAPDMREAADGLGFTKLQKMRLVELPLALPVIVAGVRTAAAMTVGIATLAAFVGAGGLGDFIYEGLSLNNNRLVLLGAIPAAILALILDFGIGQLEKTFFKRRKKRLKKKAMFVSTTLLTVLVILFVGMFFYMRSNVSPQKTVRVGTKNFTEQLILGEIIAQLLEAKTHLTVIRRFNLGGTMVCHQAIVRGDIDMYPEYTGTAYAVILRQNSLKDPAAVYRVVKQEYLTRYNLLWLPQLGFENTNALAVRKDFASVNKLITISDLVPLASKLTIGVPPDFMHRSDGFPGLKTVYDLHFANVRLMDPGLLYKAIYANRVELIMGFSTDGRILAYQLLVLKDDKELFPPYYAAPIVRLEVVKNNPEIVTALQPLTNAISNSVMRQMNYQVDEMHHSPAKVAREFLITQGLLKP